MSKAHSADIVDYRVNKQLIVFQYQRYLFATVTGAVSSAGPMMNAGSALNNKAFSPYYWMKQLYKLQDVVRQIGLPTLFTTFTINERSFPWPNWFVRDMELQDNLPVDNGMGVTLHGHHIIEQLLKGLFAGNVREGRGNPTVLRNARSGEESLKCFFYKVEFQQRGTLHVHALFWSKDVEHSQLFEKSREDFPLNDPFLCALVRTIEVRTLQVDETRRYSPALLRVLRSHHDLQFGTPRDLLLSYITHYVSKAADALDLNKRLSAEGAHKAVVGFLNKLVIGIPEMVHTLSDNKSAYFSGLGKDLKYFPPGEKRGNEVEVRLYRERPAEDGGSNFLQFWRKHTIKNINGIPVAQRYANADNQIVAVGINPPRLNNELWWEYLVFTELPHRADDDLRCADFETLPESVRYFACAYELYPGFKDVSTYIGLLTRLGQTNSMIHSMRMRYHSKVALLKYCRMDPSRIEQLIASDRENLPSLRGDQRRVYWEAAKRIKYWCINNEDVLGENNGANFEAPIVDEEEVEEVDRMRPLVMTGPPGTGKTLIMLHIAFLCIEQGMRVNISSPTGRLASNFKQVLNTRALEDVLTVDTCHATFGFGANSAKNKPSPYWGATDVFLVDECSMITYFHCNHILQQWEKEEPARRKVLIFLGDWHQLQPLTELRDGSVTTTLNASRAEKLCTYGQLMELTTNFRSGDDQQLDMFLTACRSGRMSSEICNNFRHGHTFGHRPVLVEDFKTFFTRYPEGVILTMTNRACDVINAAAFDVLARSKPVVKVVNDAMHSDLSIVLGLKSRYVLTENVDKSSDFVNGMLVTPVYVDRENIICRTATGRLVSVYKLFDKVADSWYYPMRSAYAMTIHKSQGSTLTDAVGIYFDTPQLMQKGQAYVA
ncbi:hypothetical protein FOL46_000212, partial [Perkinsus olseni]